MQLFHYDLFACMVILTLFGFVSSIWLIINPRSAAKHVLTRARHENYDSGLTVCLYRVFGVAMLSAFLFFVLHIANTIAQHQR